MSPRPAVPKGPAATTYRAGAWLSRRETLAAGALVVLGGTGWLLRPPVSAAQPAQAPAGAAESAFLAFSRAITGHDDLAPETAGRIYRAMAKLSGDFAAQAQRLAQMAGSGAEPKVLLASATAAGLRETALAVVAAWYTGTVGSGAQATLVSYAQALMYRPVRDGQSVPTYCSYGPAWWTRDPPPIGVSPPVERASAPPTTGVPAPTSGAPAPPRTEPQRSAAPGAPR
jgi:hypothetical protein